MSVFYLLYFKCTWRACCLENLMFWKILIAGCCRGLTGFNKLGLSTHNAVTTPYIDLSSIIHTVTFVSYSRFWISLFGVNTEFTIWQLNFVYIYTPPSKIKIKNYDTWPTLHVSKLKTKPQCICILTAQLHKFCALKVRQCAFFSPRLFLPFRVSQWKPFTYTFQAINGSYHMAIDTIWPFTKYTVIFFSYNHLKMSSSPSRASPSTLLKVTVLFLKCILGYTL